MNYFETKLENGIKIRCCRFPDTHSVTLVLSLKGGAAWENVQEKGITHLVEHLCFRRCAGMPQEDFYYRIERLGAFLRGTTYRDRVLFEITVNPKLFCEAVDILSDLFKDNGWTHEDIRREKEVVFRQLERPNDYCSEMLTSHFFNFSAAGLPISGKRNKIKRFSKPQLVKFKRKLFCTERAGISVAGNISEADLYYLQKIFSEIPSSASEELNSIKPKLFLNRCKKDDGLYSDDAETFKMGLSFDIDTSKIEPHEAIFLHETLCGGLLTPLNMCLREETGMLDEIKSGVEFYEFGGMMCFVFEVNRKDSSILLHKVTDILVEQKKRIDVKAFDCVYAAFTEGAEKFYDDSQGFALELSFDDKLSTPEAIIERNKTITQERICEVAVELFKPQNLIICLDDVPNERTIMDELFEKKEVLRKN